METENESTLKKLISEIKSNYQKDQVSTAFSLIVKLLNNLIANASSPDNLKYRSFKKSNNAIKSKILCIPETEGIMRHLGYTEENEDGDKGDGDLIYKGSELENLKQAVVLLSEGEKTEKNEKTEKTDKAPTQNLAKSLNSEVNALLMEEKRKKQELLKQIELDKRERATRQLATDSTAKKMNFGAKLKKFECPPNQQGG